MQTEKTGVRQQQGRSARALAKRNNDSGVRSTHENSAKYQTSDEQCDGTTSDLSPVQIHEH